MGKTRQEKIDLVIGARDETRAVLKNITNQIIGIGAAYASWRVGRDIIVEGIRSATEYEAKLKSMRSIASSTGRDINNILKEMKSHTGGLASELSVADGFLKGMTTTLTVDEISKLTTAVKNASIAMGEDFNTQLPLIIKALKQLNPAILDNIGVTVRLDQVNKKIREGFYGAGTAINEATQQNAIYQEIIKQTLIYQGQEAELLETTEGKIKKLTVAWEDFKMSLGQTEEKTGILSIAVQGLTNIVDGFREQVKFLESDATYLELFTFQFNQAIGNWDDAQSVVNKFDENFKRVKESDNLKIPLPIEDEDVDELDENLQSALTKIETFAEILGTTIGERAQAQADQLNELLGGYSHGWTVVYEEQAMQFAEYSDYVVGKEEETQRVRVGLINDTVKHVGKSNEKIKKNTNILADSMAHSFKLMSSRAIGEISFLKNRSTNLLTQLGQEFIRMTLETIAAMIIEAVKTQILTQQYISLAAAKSAVNPTSVPARLGAAAATKGGLEGIVNVPGFDDSINDFEAFKHGRDYMRKVKEGMAFENSGANFGRDFVNMSPIQQDGGSVTYQTTIHINGDSNITDETIQKIEDAVVRGTSRIAFNNGSLTSRTGARF